MSAKSLSNRIVLTFIVLFTTLVISSCRKDQAGYEKLEGDKAVLIGKWSWIYSDHSFGWCDGNSWEEVLTPLTEGINYSVEFVEEGSIKFFENNEFIEECGLVFDFFELDNNGNSFFYFYLNNDPKRGMGGGGKDTLRLKYPFVEPITGCGVYANYFIRG